MSLNFVCKIASTYQRCEMLWIYLSKTLHQQWKKVLHNPLSVYPTVHLLSRKEREVLVLVALGMNSKEISIKLDVLPKCIDNYKNRITKKLGVNGYGALGHFASENKTVLAGVGQLHRYRALKMIKR